MPETEDAASRGARPLEGKIALVTGAAKRIGRVIALELARAGADVVITYLNSQSEANDTVMAIRALGVGSVATRADLTEPEQIRAAVAAVSDGFGGLDLLVNNAGYFESVVM
jgi:3-oxoacyl-[acyl-carrier protein] reductase/pteridine reductase